MTLSVPFIADENIPDSVIRTLRARGCDVLSVKESMPACNDESILARGQDDGRVVLTHDKDFAELAFRRMLPATSGVVLFRLSGRNPEEDCRRMQEALDQP